MVRQNADTGAGSRRSLSLAARAQLFGGAVQQFAYLYAPRAGRLLSAIFVNLGIENLG